MSAKDAGVAQESDPRPEFASATFDMTDRVKIPEPVEFAYRSDVHSPVNIGNPDECTLLELAQR